MISKENNRIQKTKLTLTSLYRKLRIPCCILSSAFLFGDVDLSAAHSEEGYAPVKGSNYADDKYVRICPNPIERQKQTAQEETTGNKSFWSHDRIKCIPAFRNITTSGTISEI